MRGKRSGGAGGMAGIAAEGIDGGDGGDLQRAFLQHGDAGGCAAAFRAAIVDVDGIAIEREGGADGVVGRRRSATPALFLSATGDQAGARGQQQRGWQST